MRADEIADLLAKWFEEHSSLSCSGSLDEFSFDMNCRVSSLSKESFTLSSKHGDCSLTFSRGLSETVFAYKEPREFSGALSVPLTPEQELSSMVVILLHPGSFPVDSSKPRDKLVLMEIVE